MNRKTRPFQHMWFKVVLLIAAGASLLLVGAAKAQSQLPGIPLTSGPGNDFRPVWSPDGSVIVFFSNREGDNDIWLVNRDNTGLRQLTSGPADDRRPSWSPDGEWITFDSDREGNKDIWVVSVDGGEPIRITSAASRESFPSWSPDGSMIAYYGYEDGVLDLWVVAIEDALQGGQTGEPRQVAASLADEKRQDCTYACHYPAWSPDGKEIAYGRTNQTQVWVVGSDGGNPHMISDSGNRMHSPWWTAEGKLLMLSEHNNDQQEPVNDVWEVDADGSNPTLLFTDIPHGGPFYWDPTDLKSMAFHSPRAGTFDIYLTRLGEAPIEVASPPLPTEAEIQPPQQAATAVSEIPETGSDGSLPDNDTPIQEVGEASNGRLSWPVALFGGLWLALAAILILAGLAAVVYLFRKR